MSQIIELINRCCFCNQVLTGMALKYYVADDYYECEVDITDYSEEDKKQHVEYRKALKLTLDALNITEPLIAPDLDDKKAWLAIAEGHAVDSNGWPCEYFSCCYAGTWQWRLPLPLLEVKCMDCHNLIGYINLQYKDEVFAEEIVDAVSDYAEKTQCVICHKTKR